MRFKVGFVSAVLVAGTLVPGAPASAVATTPTPSAGAVAALDPPAGSAPAGGTPLLPVRPCADLVGDLPLVGAVTHVTSATVVPATESEPEHCDVRGYVEPAVRFQLRLPTTGYTGRYLQYGCGGMCGMIFTPPFPTCAGRPSAGFAVAATDDGHVGGDPYPPLDGSWAANDQAARDDFAFRAPHVLSRAAKQIITGYYGSPPRHSYFGGCSNGGREALLLAQRYPDDFDGIVAGAPAAVFAPLAGIYQSWLARANTAADGSPIITLAKLPVLHEAVLAACDGLDGLVDGQIDDPGACRFDPAAIGCPTAADEPGCLTAAQVDAARKLYGGPIDPTGVRLYPGGQPRGSELAWAGWVVPVPELGGSFARTLGDNFLRYGAYPIGTPHSSVDEISFTVAELRRLTPEGVKSNAMSLDLGRFRRSGGKLIIWHGSGDEAIPPAGTLDYYQRLWQHDGGLRRTQEYARVFMVPSMYHCAGGDRLTEFDPLPALVRWVEAGSAPRSIVARQRDEQGTVLRTRPVFPYPLRARYDGTGSIDDAGNFVPVAPAGTPNDVIRWAGEDLYGRPGPVAP